MGKIKCGVVGVGNCFAGLYQGLHYYKENPEKGVIGLMHQDMAGYRTQDIEFVSAFDVGSNKVGKSLDEATYAEPNMVDWIRLPKSDVIVQESPVLDGVGKYVEDVIKPVTNKPISQLREDIKKHIKETGTEIIVSYLPVGSQKAAEFWAETCLEAGVAFVNCMPVFIASDPDWEKKFREKKVPVIGDDIKGQIGATIVHRVLTRLTQDRGAELDKTYQLNVGGNTDFQNMLERSRLESKKVSKTESVQSQMKNRIPEENIHIGPSDHVPFLQNTKLCFLYMEGRQWADIPYKIDLKLDVDDKANSAGIVVDAVRAAKIALDRGYGGAIESASAYLMKHPPVQMSDPEAKAALEYFIMGKEQKLGK
ncbi:myo-inositol-1-phosphate synthase [Candidatus Micrarchaeota archaeon]|nr:myo-inositol-1-phosphate synthase [Candidatus Micrarchaeota archaeon]MBD3418069.1 myo-inositol-1-phosphate synthase [Candidatus Micrarchaeota archaeon]